MAAEERVDSPERPGAQEERCVRQMGRDLAGRAQDAAANRSADRDRDPERRAEDTQQGARFDAYGRYLVGETGHEAPLR